MEEICVEFDMSTKEAVEKIKLLESPKYNQIQGILDERGYYIYISPEELKSLVSLIESKG